MRNGRLMASLAVVATIVMIAVARALLHHSPPTPSASPAPAASPFRAYDAIVTDEIRSYRPGHCNGRSERDFDEPINFNAAKDLKQGEHVHVTAIDYRDDEAYLISNKGWSGCVSSEAYLAAYGSSDAMQALAAAQTSSDSETSAAAEAATPVETPTPDTEAHNRRAAARQYYDRVVDLLAISASAVGLAGQAYGNGDAVGAQQLITKGQESAQRAYDAASNDEPSGDPWSSVQSELMDSASKFKDALAKVSDALDANSSKQMAEALDLVGQARESYEDAAHQARVWYRDNGGKPSDLEDLDKTIKLLDSFFKTMQSQ